MANERPVRLEANVTTGEVLEIPLTDEEIAELENMRVAAEEREARRAAEEAAVAAAKESAKAKLTALGLTDEEIAALGK